MKKKINRTNYRNGRVGTTLIVVGILLCKKVVQLTFPDNIELEKNKEQEEEVEEQELKEIELRIKNKSK